MKILVMAERNDKKLVNVVDTIKAIPIRTTTTSVNECLPLSVELDMLAVVVIIIWGPGHDCVEKRCPDVRLNSLGQDCLPN